MRVTRRCSRLARARGRPIDSSWCLQETRAKETITQLKLEIANLTQVVEEGAGFNLEEESAIEELVRRRDELIKERDSQTNQIIQLRNQVAPRMRSVPSKTAILADDGDAGNAEKGRGRTRQFS